MDPHGPMVTWPHVIKTASDQGSFPHSLGKPGVMAHQEDDITLFPSFIEALCTSPHSPSNQQEDHSTLQGIPLTSTRETLGISPR
jgi:hypothetical protein